MTTHLLSRKAHRPANGLRLSDDILLPRARAHEVCGPARWSFALWVASAIAGPILWIVPAWFRDQLNPDGVSRFTDPARFLFVRPTRGEDLLWCVEESLRSGAAALVVCELPAPPAMTPVRRLHLAAEEGSTQGPAPMALLLTPDQGGAPGIETRWHMAPAHTPTAARWRLERLRARTQPPKSWLLQSATGPTPLEVIPNVQDT
ncbi:hypothetical protein GFB49_10340 [Epibacterium sp. SM1979]|uniref:Protein ImuA n=1 Tax=Tritonibacter litoralis TaxID=2662264 RepID=A0A843YHG1_9RHOB|nr:hypothetical protein [Tritonibacter litoralis]MQQ08854.1 hypothetical protein [Tritonibacter litoralis]